MKIKYLVTFLAALSSSVAFANEPAKQADPAKQAANAAISAACAADGKAAGCGDKQVGTGLLRCIHDYKQAHKDFTVSAGCKAEVEKHHKPNPAIQADNAAINTACATDSQTAGCTGKQVGSSLLKCLHEYKQAHKEFALSAGCKEAIQKRQADQKHKKEEHKDK